MSARPTGSTSAPTPAREIGPVRSRAARILAFLLIAAAVIGAAHLLDVPVAMRVRYPGAGDADWGRMLRVAGYVPTWVLVSIALVLIDRARLRAGWAPAFPFRDMWSRGVLLAGAAAASGLLAEGVKLVVRRERPQIADGRVVYAFRALADQTLSTAGLGMASSHAAVAFGAGFMLWRLHPAGWPVWLALGVGCAATRVLSSAHFVSDVVAGAVVGYAVAWALWRWHARNAAGERRGARAPGGAGP